MGQWEGYRRTAKNQQQQQQIFIKSFMATVLHPHKDELEHDSTFAEVLFLK